MAVRTVTSDPQPSKRIHGYFYVYYNKKLDNGGECLALIHPALRDIVKKGFIFDDGAVHFDPNYNASILALDFDEAPDQDPALPPDPEAGWGDPDDLVATASEPSTNGHAIPNRGVRPATVRRRLAAAQDPDFAHLPAPLMKISMEVNRVFLMQYKLLGSSVGDNNRAFIAQKLTACAVIPFYKAAGISLDDEDIAAISSM